jgi:hypothetical protein
MEPDYIKIGWRRTKSVDTMAASGPCEERSRLLGRFTEAVKALSVANRQLPDPYVRDAFKLAWNRCADARKHCADARHALDVHRLAHSC